MPNSRAIRLWPSLGRDSCFGRFRGNARKNTRGGIRREGVEPRYPSVSGFKNTASTPSAISPCLGGGAPAPPKRPPYASLRYGRTRLASPTNCCPAGAWRRRDPAKRLPTFAPSGRTVRSHQQPACPAEAGRRRRTAHRQTLSHPPCLNPGGVQRAGDLSRVCRSSLASSARSAPDTPPGTVSNAAACKRVSYKTGVGYSTSRHRSQQQDSRSDYERSRTTY